MVICDVCGEAVVERIGEYKPHKFDTLESVQETCRKCAWKISDIKCKLDHLKNQKIGKVENEIHAEFNRQVDELKACANGTERALKELAE